MKTQFKQFMGKLETTDNKLVLEAIEEGFNAIFEGYADVRDIETEDALTVFNRQAANVATNQGNPVLQFLQNSAAKTAQMYTFDDEPELDSRDTIDYREYLVNTPGKTSYEDSLGLTASDLSNSNKRQIDNDLGIDFELEF